MVVKGRKTTYFYNSFKTRKQWSLPPSYCPHHLLPAKAGSFIQGNFNIALIVLRIPHVIVVDKSFNDRGLYGIAQQSDITINIMISLVFANNEKISCGVYRNENLFKKIIYFLKCYIRYISK